MQPVYAGDSSWTDSEWGVEQPRLYARLRATTRRVFSVSAKNPEDYMYNYFVDAKGYSNASLQNKPLFLTNHNEGDSVLFLYNPRSPEESYHLSSDSNAYWEFYTIPYHTPDPCT